MAVAEGLQCVDEDNIQISVQAAVLKAVVQNDELRVEFVNRGLSSCDSIWVLNVRNVRQPLLKLHRFVVGRPVFCAIAAACQGNSHVSLTKPASQPGDHRCFSRAARRNVPYANDGDVNTVYVTLVLIEAAISPANRVSIGYFARTQERPPQCGSQPTALAADDLTMTFCAYQFERFVVANMMLKVTLTIAKNGLQRM